MKRYVIVEVEVYDEHNVLCDGRCIGVKYDDELCRVFQQARKQSKESRQMIGRKLTNRYYRCDMCLKKELPLSLTTS